jgi:hypothetical protein
VQEKIAAEDGKGNKKKKKKKKRSPRNTYSGGVKEEGKHVKGAASQCMGWWSDAAAGNIGREERLTALKVCGHRADLSQCIRMVLWLFR